MVNGVSALSAATAAQSGRGEGKPLPSQVGSRGEVTLRPSQLDLDVRVSVHLAPDILSFRFCSCGCSHDRIRGLPLSWRVSSSDGSHRCDVGESLHLTSVLDRILCMHGSAVGSL